jgi:DNA polymerase
MEAAWELIKTGDRAAILRKYPSVMEVLACALRGAIIASKSSQLFVADYAGIEVRVLWWVADDKVGLKLLQTPGADPYCSLASDICRRPITKVDPERQLGKAGILGCGYGMGAAKFVGTAKDMFGLTVTEEESQNVVDTYRAKFHRTKKFWYETEDAACAAVRTPGKVVKQKWVSWQRVVDKARGTDFLYCTLPNGRRLAYPFPELRKKETPWGEMKYALTFMAVSAYTRQWTREHTYGGKLVENIVQAISRDIMAEALQRCEASGVYIPILSIHDEIMAEVAVGRGTDEEFERLLTSIPKWAPGCPISAEGWHGNRYRK